jgi:hypothetical protein
MLQGLILICALSSACWEKHEKKRKKKKRERSGLGLFFPGPEPDMPCWLCQEGFSRLLGAIKGQFKGQSLNFICS